ncbi:hypothetical protein KBB96_00325 [Luteolibacter ambystomatis]|uniref:Uncharacterized protein n=2 Tax=Luteolibacter ambystomatis TaxID=2824561 RepID=A0A975IZD7_9BACT|nr:hypothetical protein [Luteolibacter ambystomatis]QUE51361.1 hypothetical protein KBB96_00325 [Luteolibacter ambystomatis]
MAGGQEPAPAAAKAPDFSTGFQQLISLGLPPLKDAEWITASANENGDDYELREVLEGLKGGGWKMQVEGKATFLGMGAVDLSEPADTGGSGGGGLLGNLFGGGSKKKGKAGDLIADATKLIANLNNAGKSEKLRENIEYRADSLGKLLIFAAQLHQTGHPEEANRLATAVFSLGASPETVIDTAVNQLAARDLNRVTEAFFTSHDWTAYDRDLKSLIARYSRGWDHLLAAQMLQPVVAKRAANQPAPKPELRGIPLKPEALAALEATLQVGKATIDDEALNAFARENQIDPSYLKNPRYRQQLIEMMTQSGGSRSTAALWLIQNPPAADATNPWDQLKRLNMDALPALAAVAADDTLTYSRNNRGGGSRYFSSSESPAERAVKAYRDMDRPLTRGELACQLIESTLPGTGNETREADTLAQAALEFWKTNRNKSRLELIQVFLADGSEQQKFIALDVLATMPDKTARTAFEAQVLADNQALSSLDAVTTYLTLHKAEAKEFFSRFSTALKSQAEGVDLDRIRNGYQIRRDGGLDKFLRKLSILVGGESPRKLVLDLAKAEKTDAQQIRTVGEALAKSSPAEFIALYLEAAASSKRAETSSAFLQMLLTSDHPEQEEKPDAPKPLPPAHIPYWKTLLANDSTLPDGGTLRNVAATTMERMLQGEEFQATYFESYRLDSAATDAVMVARALERVEGKEPGPFPNATQVSAARMNDLVGQAKAAKPEDIPALVKGWSLAEKLAFKAWRTDPANKDMIPASMIASRKRVLPPEDGPRNPAAAKASETLTSLGIPPGTTLDADRLLSLVDKLAAEAKTRSGLLVSFYGSDGLDTGFTTQVLPCFDPDSKKSAAFAMATYSMYTVSSLFESGSDSSTPPEGMVLVNFGSSSGRSQHLTWTLANGTVTAPADTTPLRNAMTALDQPDAQTLYLMISVLHREDTAKAANLRRALNSEGDTDDSE